MNDLTKKLTVMQKQDKKERVALKMINRAQSIATKKGLAKDGEDILNDLG